MRRPTPRRLWRFVTERLRLAAYLRRRREGRVRPQIPAGVLLWALLLGQAAGVEFCQRSPRSAA